MQESVIKQRN